MSDFIRRQDAYNLVKQYFRENYVIDGDWYADEIIRELEDLPSAEPKVEKWIPCSERLPELNQICIVTDETRRCAYEYGLHGETYDEENGWTYLGHRIVAWMPLPEPYKEREDE